MTIGNFLKKNTCHMLDENQEEEIKEKYKLQEKLIIESN